MPSKWFDWLIKHQITSHKHHVWRRFWSAFARWGASCLNEVSIEFYLNLARNDSSRKRTLLIDWLIGFILSFLHCAALSCALLFCVCCLLVLLLLVREWMTCEATKREELRDAETVRLASKRDKIYQIRYFLPTSHVSRRGHAQSVKFVCLHFASVRNTTIRCGGAARCRELINLYLKHIFFFFFTSLQFTTAEFSSGLRRVRAPNATFGGWIAHP